MAIRFDAAADRLLRTSDMLDYNAAYTFCGWFYLAGDTIYDSSGATGSVSGATILPPEAQR